MKCFQSFRLDSANHCLWRGEERVAMAPKPYDVLRYLVENPGRLVTHDELLENLWRETYVNPELIRKYIVDIRKTLGDRPDKPEFIETVTKRGYRFIAPVKDDTSVDESGPPAEIALATQEEPAPVTLAPEPGELLVCTISLRTISVRTLYQVRPSALSPEGLDSDRLGCRHRRSRRGRPFLVCAK